MSPSCFKEFRVGQYRGAEGENAPHFLITNIMIIRIKNPIFGVPITFLDKYNPNQFEIVGLDRYVEDNPHYGHRFTINGKETYARILIRFKK